MSLTVGSKGKAETVVTEQNTANAVGSGLVPGCAAPEMVARMASAAVKAVPARRGEGQGTVGTKLDVTHDAATPIGLKVWAEAELTAAEGKKLTFAVKAFDEAGPIGGGTHERFIITVDRFLAKAEAKKGGN